MLSAFTRLLRCLFVASLSGALVLSHAVATTPDRSWGGVKRLVVLVDVRSGPQDAVQADSFCAAIKRIAEQGAPVPVECVGFGDPALLANDAVALIAQAAVQELGSGRILIFSTRKDREGGLDPQPVLIGAAPRAVPLTGSAEDQNALETALNESLSEVLPWLRSGETKDLLPTSERERIIG